MITYYFVAWLCFGALANLLGDVFFCSPLFFKLEYRGPRALEIWNDLFVVKDLEIALCRTYGTVLLTDWGDRIKCKKPSGQLLVSVIWAIAYKNCDLNMRSNELYICVIHLLVWSSLYKTLAYFLVQLFNGTVKIRFIRRWSGFCFMGSPWTSRISRVARTLLVGVSSGSDSYWLVKLWVLNTLRSKS